MSWLKYTPVFKHGYGTVGYSDLGENPSEDAIDDEKSHIRDTEGDPEGFREPKWEIVDHPPVEYVAALVDAAQQRFTYAQKNLSRLRELHRSLTDVQNPAG